MSLTTDVQINPLLTWCEVNNLGLNTLKIVQILVDFRKNLPQLTLCGSPIRIVESLNFLSTIINQNLMCELKISSRNFHNNLRILTCFSQVHFYVAITESTLTFSTTWYAAFTANDTNRLQHNIHSAERVFVFHYSRIYRTPGHLTGQDCE